MTNVEEVRAVVQKPSRRSVHRTQWASQFAVASELCKRGHEVAFTMGNHPSVDLMVWSPREVPFGVDVKGLYRRNFWLVSAKPAHLNLFYVFAYVPDDAPNRFFILTQDQVNEGIVADSDRARERAAAKGRTINEADFTGISWAVAERYENAWETLPA